MSGGFILIHRALLDHHIFNDEPYCERMAWMWMLMQASYEPHKIRYHNQLIEVGRGDVPTSYRRLQDAWKWGVHRVRNFLAILEQDRMITRKIETGFLVINICNYGQYQDSLRNATTLTATPTTTHATTPTATNITKRTQVTKIIKTTREKISLEELSADHIASWLARKRSEGRYLNHDEYFILEYFKNYCESGKKYDNYISALRNAFEWESCQPKSIAGTRSPTKDDRARAAVMRAAQAGGFAH